MTPPVALTIAGSDSGGGAGIQADLKAFAANRVFGATAITAITAQNTRGVEAVEVLDVALVAAQIEAVLADLPVAATKTGMLATSEIVALVADNAHRLPNLVVDPVMVAASGDRLLDLEAERAYPELLFPHALVVTPNLREAQVLVGRPLTGVDDMVAAGKELAATGVGYVVVKGGHLEGDSAIDVVVSRDGRVETLERPRVPTRNVHGTGCTFASAIAARLAWGDHPLEAIAAAKEYVHRAIEGAADWKLGSGHGPVDHFGWGRP
jgi:hydroxymethylpyrimidine/phosphomethylpyrimidine kinase